jgi:hypothetical protein
MNEALRRELLRRFGETVVLEQLTKKGYRCTIIGGNSPCFDIEAYDENDEKILVQVKTRNHTTSTGEIKIDSYGLFHKNKSGEIDTQVRMVKEISRQQKATQMWAAVRVDAPGQSYTICYGLVADLKNKKQIPMSPSDIRRHKKLADNVFDGRIDPELSNVRRTKRK